MNWRDLLYFSKGERKALTLPLCLISISWIILLVTDNKQNYTSNENKQVTEPVKTTRNTIVDRPNPEKAKQLHPGEKIIPSERNPNSSREKLKTHLEERHFPKSKNILPEQSSN